MTRFWLVIILGMCLGHGLRAGDMLKIWDYSDLKDILLSCSAGNKAAMHLDTEHLTATGNKTLAVTLEKLSPEAVPWAVQLRFLYDKGLKAGHEYELSFYCKSKVPGTLQMIVAMAGKPWTALPGTRYSVNITEEWQMVKIRFKVENDRNELLAVPRMMLAEYGEGIIYFGPVSLTEASTPHIVSLNREWKLFSGVENYDFFDRCPDSKVVTVGTLKSWKVKLDDNSIDIARTVGRFGKKECALLFNSFESSKAGYMRLGVSADWWLELFINGRKVFSNFPGGNGTKDFSVDDHVVDIPVKAGTNLLAARVLSGSDGWRFVCGTPSRAPDAPGLFVVRPGEDWKAVDMDKLQVKAGTTLDFSGLTGTRSEAGNLGRVIVNGNGNLAFEKKPDEAVRFLSFNFMSSSWRLKAHLWSKKDIEDFAAAVARQGYNMIRFHNNDRFLLGWKVNERPLKRIVESEIPQSGDLIEFDAGNLDRFDYLLACLKKNGVYINLDLMTSPTGYTMAHPNLTPRQYSFKYNLFTSAAYRQHWLAATTYVLNHYNKYTGMALKDDPALAIVEPLNEQDLLLYDPVLMRELTPGFHRYLKDKYPNDEALRNAWNINSVSLSNLPEIDENLLRRGDGMAADAGNYLIKVMSEMTDFYYRGIRTAGYPGLFTQWDMIIRTMEIPVRAMLPVIAQHVYFSHPTIGKIPTKNLVKKSKMWSKVAGNPRFDAMCEQSSSINSSFFRAAAAARFLDRPFMITEYSHSSYNRYRHERGLFFGSYAALQGWSSLTAHGHVVAVRDTTYEPFTWFENAIDPISRASEVVAALTWLRGDVKEAPHSVLLKLNGKSMFPKNLLSAIGDDYAKLAMLTRIGIAYPEVKPLEAVGMVAPDLILPLTDYSPLSVKTWYVEASSRDGQCFPQLMEKLKEKNIITSNNRSNYNKRIFQSETGEINLNGKDNTLTVITPRLEGAIIKKDNPVQLSVMKIKHCSQPASVTIASLEPDKKLVASKRLLLVISTNALNSGMTFENSSCRLLIDVGDLPVLMKTVVVGLELTSTNPKTPFVFALNLDGTRAEQLPCDFRDGQLSLRVDTVRLKYATPFFEIIYP